MTPTETAKAANDELAAALLNHVREAIAAFDDHYDNDTDFEDVHDAIERLRGTLRLFDKRSATAFLALHSPPEPERRADRNTREDGDSSDAGSTSGTTQPLNLAAVKLVRDAALNVCFAWDQDREMVGKRIVQLRESLRILPDEGGEPMEEIVATTARFMGKSPPPSQSAAAKGGGA